MSARSHRKPLYRDRHGMTQTGSFSVNQSKRPSWAIDLNLRRTGLGYSYASNGKPYYGAVKAKSKKKRGTA